MTISIALCTYNGEKFLLDQLESIAQQTLLPDELVVCDDCSSDNTLKILNSFKERVNFPVQIHQNKKNLGSTKNFEKVIRLCSGDLIALCDQDDIWKPHKLEKLVGLLNTDQEAGYVFSDAELIDEQLQPLGPSLWDSMGFSGDIRKRFIRGEQFQCLFNQHIVTGATMVFRDHVGKLALPFLEGGKWIHDGWISLVASSIGCYGIPVDEPLIAYRQHAGQQIGVPDLSGENKKQKTLLEKYRELKSQEEYLFSEWEKRGQQFLSVIPSVRDKLVEIKKDHYYPSINKNLKYLSAFETHFLNRRKILTSKGLGRYGLILREVFSGRYVKFSDSWRTIFRDLFL